MSPSTTLETPVMENKPFLMRDPLLMEEAIFMKDDDDDFSTDSWDRVSNDDFVHMPATMVSRPTSPATSATSTGESATYIIEEEAEDTIRALNQLDSPPFLIKMEPEQSPPPSFTAFDALDEEKLPDSLLNSTMETTKQQQQQQQNNINLLNDSPETRAMKRERNRLAARRCRQKQKDRIDYLEKDVKQIETDNFKVENEIKMLRQQLNDLQNALLNHDCIIPSRQHHFYSVKF